MSSKSYKKSPTKDQVMSHNVNKKRPTEDENFAKKVNEKKFQKEDEKQKKKRINWEEHENIQSIYRKALSIATMGLPHGAPKAYRKSLSISSMGLPHGARKAFYLFIEKVLLIVKMLL